MNRFFQTAIVAAFVGTSAHAVTVNGGYQTTEPTSSQVTNYPTSGTTPWDYVGYVLDANGEFGSGVYLGNGWVLTQTHVLASSTSTFALGGSTYGISNVQNVSGSADLAMFQLVTTSNLSDPNLATLTLSTTVQDSHSAAMNSNVLVIGYGSNGAGESWGLTKLDGWTATMYGNGYTTQVFEMDSATTQGHPGDSGGGVFAYNSTSGTWTLIGDTNSIYSTQTTYAVDVASYYTQIEGIMAVPEPKTWGYLIFGLAMMLRLSRRATQLD